MTMIIMTMTMIITVCRGVGGGWFGLNILRHLKGTRAQIKPNPAWIHPHSIIIMMMIMMITMIMRMILLTNMISNAFGCYVFNPGVGEQPEYFCAILVKATHSDPIIILQQEKFNV